MYVTSLHDHPRVLAKATQDATVAMSRLGKLLSNDHPFSQADLRVLIHEIQGNLLTPSPGGR
jgi:hypothetical protein